MREVERGNLPVKGWLGAVNKLAKLAKSTQGRKAAEKFGVSWSDVLPLPEVSKAKNEKIISFREKQLAREFTLH